MPGYGRSVPTGRHTALINVQNPVPGLKAWAVLLTASRVAQSNLCIKRYSYGSIYESQSFCYLTAAKFVINLFFQSLMPSMKRNYTIEKLSTRLALLVLAVGFASLGFLSFLNRPLEPADTGLISVTTYSIIGSTVGVLVGLTFLTAALVFARPLRREGWDR